MNSPALAISALLALSAPVRAQPKAADKAPAASDILVTVEGIPITREEVAQRLWTQGASGMLSQIVDDLAVNKALSAWRVKQTKKEHESMVAEVAARLGRIKSQFKDESEFLESLKKNGTELAGIETQLREQFERERLIISAKNISVTPAEIREFYDANKGKLGGPPAVRLRHMFTTDEKQAKDFFVAVQAGADFGKLAQKKSLDTATKDKGGDLGFVTTGNAPPDIEKQIFGLKDGEVSEVLQLPDGFHIFKAEERRVPKEPSFEEAQKDISDAILGHKITKVWPSYVAELRAAIKIVPSPGVTMPPASSSGAARL